MAFLFGGGNKKNDQPAQDTPPPQAAPVLQQDDPEALKRVGRGSLISTSPRGILGNSNTSRKLLTP